MASSIFGDNWRKVIGFSTDGSGRDTGYIRVSVGSGGENPSGGAGLFSSPVIFTGFNIELREKIQVLETFNEFVHVYAFGRGVGNATLSGLVVALKGDLSPLKSQLINSYETKLRARKLAEKGNVAIISGPGGVVVQGVTHTLRFGMQASGDGGDNLVNFTMVLVTAGGRGSSLSAGT